MPRIRLVLVTLIAALVIGPAAASATPGSLDRNFGSGGKLTSGFGDAEFRSIGAATQWFADGSFMTATYDEERLVLTRYEADGQVDRTFGENGFALTPNNDGRREFKVTGVFTTSDGRTNFFGLDGSFGGRIVFGRLDADGKLDHTLGNKGFRWGPRFGDPWSWNYDPWGRLVISDRSFNDRPDRIYRFNSVGKLDSSFGEGGLLKYFHPAESTGVDRVYPTETGIFITDKKRIIRLLMNGETDLDFGQEGEVRGQQYFFAADPSQRPIVLRGGRITRLLPDGSLDTSFGPSGNGQVSPGGLIDEYISLPDGSTVLRIKDWKLDQDGLLLLDPDGAFDQGFGTDGFVPLPSPDFVLGRGPGAGIYLTEYSNDGTFILQLDPGGSPVGSFGENGRLEVRANAPTDDRLSEAVRRKDGSLLLAGLSERGILLQSFTRRGRPEKEFGSQGSLLLAPLDSKTRSTAPRLVLAPDGSGFVCARSGGGSFLWNVTRLGKLEASFGSEGTVELPGSNSCRDLTLDGNGVIVAYENPSTRHLDIARYRVDGTIDTGYGQGGKARIPIKYGISGYQKALLTTDRKGRTIVLGEDEGIVLLRFLEDGSPDAAFGKNGFVRYGVKPRPGSKRKKLNLSMFWSLAMDGTGNILIGGSTKAGPVIARIGETGRPDRRFGKGGVVSLPAPETKRRRYKDQVLGMTRQEDGKLVVVGQHQPKCHSTLYICPQPMFIYRLTERGKLDRKFTDRATKSAWTPGDSQGVAAFADKRGITVARTMNTSVGRNDFSLFRVER